MRYGIVKLVVGLGVGMLSWPALAGEAEVRELVAKLSAGKATISRLFPAPELGMTGVVLNRGREQVVVFADNAGKYLMSGVAMAADGTNLTRKYADLYVYRAMYDEVAKSNWIHYGSAKAKKVIYVLGEANCGYCKRLHRDLKPFVERGELAVRWVLIGFTPEADDSAAGVLAAKDAGKALDSLYGDGQGGAATPAALVKVKANHELFEKYGVQGTPFMLYRTQSGEVRTAPGALQGKAIDDMVAALAG